MKFITGKKILVSDLRREGRGIKAEIERAVRRVIASGWYILGREVESFEKEFAAYCGSSYAVGVASGTEALQLSLAALSIGEGDEVITAVNTAIPTAMAILALGAEPKFVDVDLESLNIDVEKIAKAITRRTKAIVPVHLYGSPCDIEKVLKVAQRYNLFVVEDACQAHGAIFGGKKAGTFGDIGAFSFYPTKNLGCYGDGGMAITDNKRLARGLKVLRNYGQSSRYRCEIRGINSRLDEIQAAILRVKLRHLNRFNARRIEIADLYARHLAGVEEVRIPPRDNRSRHVFHLYVISCERRDSLRRYLAQRGIETQVHYPIPLHLQPAFRGLGYEKGSFPIAESLARKILSLPIFPDLKDEEIEKICGHIKSFYRR